MGRWYDKHTKLAEYLESLKSMDSSYRERVVRDLIELIRSSEPGVLEEFVLDFPLDVYRRRWYDKDPYLWMIFNGLGYASDNLLTRVVCYFDTHYKKCVD